jgi:hypothetical protein
MTARATSPTAAAATATLVPPLVVEGGTTSTFVMAASGIATGGPLVLMSPSVPRSVSPSTRGLVTWTRDPLASVTRACLVGAGGAVSSASGWAECGCRSTDRRAPDQQKSGQKLLR